MSEVRPQPTDTDNPQVLHAVSRFLESVSAATQSDKMPVPRLNQFMDKPNTRRLFGHVFVAMMLEWSQELSPNDDLLLTEDESIRKGREIFAKLDEFREGPEGLIGKDSRDTVHALAEEVDTAQLRIGRQILLALQGYQAHGTANDAFLAMELHAIAQTGESAA